MVKSVSCCCVRGKLLFSNLVTNAELSNYHVHCCHGYGHMVMGVVAIDTSAVNNAAIGNCCYK